MVCLILCDARLKRKRRGGGAGGCVSAPNGKQIPRCHLLQPLTESLFRLLRLNI
jgi:hypothetical protein